MAIGPGIYFNKYKDYSVEELERELEKLQKYLSSDELKKARQEEIDKEIDDNNCITNVITEINVVKDLLKRKNKGFIRKTKIDENGMEYEVEEIFDLPKKISVEHIDLPILEQEKNIEKIGLILDMPIANTELNSKRIEEIKATYYYNPNRGGKSIIVGDDGSYLLTISSAIYFEELLEEYKNGRRNGNFNIYYESLLQNIMESYKEKGITLYLIEMLNNFANRLIKRNKQDPFWTDIARDVLQTMIILNLAKNSKISIEDLVEQSKDINNVRYLCKDNLDKLDISKVQTYGNFINSIKMIKQENNEKTLSSILEIIYKELKCSINNGRIEDINMKDEELKKMVQEVIGNSDPYWNNPVYDIVKKIIDLPFETDITIAELINYNPNEVIIDPLTQGQITNLVEAVCKKNNIKLERTRDKVGGLAYYYSFKKIAMKNETLNKPKCPRCGEILMYLMPDGSHFYCKNCEKNYLNNNGDVGCETTSPYNKNDDVLY